MINDEDSNEKTGKIIFKKITQNKASGPLENLDMCDQNASDVLDRINLLSFTKNVSMKIPWPQAESSCEGQPANARLFGFIK